MLRRLPPKFKFNPWHTHIHDRSDFRDYPLQNFSKVDHRQILGKCGQKMSNANLVLVLVVWI